MDKQLFFTLLDKYLQGTASQAEEALIMEYYRRLDDKGKTTLSAEQEHALRQLMLQNIHQAISSAEQNVRKLRMRRYYAVAASLAIILAFGLYLFRYKSKRTAEPYTIAKHRVDYLPGGNKAVLTLANGTEIILDDAENGVIARQSGIVIRKDHNGNIVYDATNNLAATDAAAINTITTPRGGQYRVILPDGTKVWLNAQSSLSYPVVFAKNERRVTLKGEGYFEVAKAPLNPPKGGKSSVTNSLSFGEGRGEARLPFIVTAADQEVEVLGTHFNINAYTDEEAVRTTLLEGSVKVSHLSSHISRLLQPGQQSINTGNAINVRKVDTEVAVAWKNGRFQFNDADLETIMRQISRWYDVDVEFANAEPAAHYNGEISRNVNLSQVLKILELSGVKFNVKEGRRIIVKQQ